MATSVYPYSVLARGYDAVMEHVDYVAWAEYVDELVQLHGGSPTSILELGCGTGSFALHFSQLFDADYVATDGSGDMLDVAVAKHRQARTSVQFNNADFRGLKVGRKFDLVILLYDGLNYLTEIGDVGRLFEDVSDLLEPGGRFIFDQATPANSINNRIHFEDSGSCEAFTYVRRSTYDEESGLHETLFELDSGSELFVERHVQRPYAFSLIRDILTASPLEEVAAYADFLLKHADDTAERIHWVTRKPLKKRI